jgi:hypothetical protein
MKNWFKSQIVIVNTPLHASPFDAHPGGFFCRATLQPLLPDSHISSKRTIKYENNHIGKIS